MPRLLPNFSLAQVQDLLQGGAGSLLRQATTLTLVTSFLFQSLAFGDAQLAAPLKSAPVSPAPQPISGPLLPILKDRQAIKKACETPLTKELVIDVSDKADEESLELLYEQARLQRPMVFVTPAGTRYHPTYYPLLLDLGLLTAEVHPVLFNGQRKSAKIKRSVALLSEPQPEADKAEEPNKLTEQPAEQVESPEPPEVTTLLQLRMSAKERLTVEAEGLPINSPSLLLRYKQSYAGKLDRYYYQSLSLLDLQKVLNGLHVDLATLKLLKNSRKAHKRFEQAATKHEALTAYRQAETGYHRVMQMLFPQENLQARAVWLDRGSLVKAKTPEGLKQLVKQLADVGTNLIFVESINAGFPIYPSKVLPQQNPEFQGWDPLKLVIDEAHKNGIHVHAWVWCFAVGNTRHNALIKQPEAYRGPLLSSALLDTEQIHLTTGAAVPINQHEYWLDPSSEKGKTLLKEAYKELVTTYPLDGLQLDYIRYPFQRYDETAGVGSKSLALFKEQTGKTLNEKTNPFYDAEFRQWKASQVSGFVQTLSSELKAVRPDLTLSAAVFAMPREARLQQIQQDWETWVANGWIDVLVPMIYTDSSDERADDLRRVQRAAAQGALVYPGLGLHKLATTPEMLEHLLITQQHGAPGHTLFAMSHLDPERLGSLKAGPYQKKTSQPLPHINPELALEHAWQQWQPLLAEAKLTLPVLEAPRPTPLSEEQAVLSTEPTEVKQYYFHKTLDTKLELPLIPVATQALEAKRIEETVTREQLPISEWLALHQKGKSLSSLSPEGWAELEAELTKWLYSHYRHRQAVTLYLEGKLLQMRQLYYFIKRQNKQARSSELT